MDSYGRGEGEGLAVGSAGQGGSAVGSVRIGGDFVEFADETEHSVFGDGDVLNDVCDGPVIGCGLEARL